jgi:hypothetical protein
MEMIVNKDLNSGDPTLKKWMTAIRYLHMAKRPVQPEAPLPPLPIESLQWAQLARTFHHDIARTRLPSFRDFRTGTQSFDHWGRVEYSFWEKAIAGAWNDHRASACARLF